MRPGPEPNFYRGLASAVIATAVILGLIFGLPALVLLIGLALGIDVP